ncbi:signal peptide peptidase SppA [Bacteroides sp. 519]|uniref:signal peptide peptidase SppA n=1 Tax=Bacteroides sp. 519 TaxID=2302937 RepID=UPI0013D23755|nr:signal peptide peptidase SppA [Bacteroides sp. 519]NDV58153.1 signal peptide peptidase SppA [Bacteroides sp. 519]
MKDFLKYTLATITGIVLSGVVIFIIGIFTVVGMLSNTNTETVVSKNSVMMLNLNGMLSERSVDIPFAELLGQDVSYGLDDVLASIKKAKEHDDIKGIYIQANALGASFASLQEIRDALVDFKTSGKFIIAYADTYTQRLYYLSSVADEVLLNPKGAIEWRGIASHPVFYKNLLDKIGVEMEIFKVGTYKSAVEPYINTEMSDANREQVTVYINSVWDELLDDVSASRNISKDDLNMIADKMLIFHAAEENIRYGLADTLIYKNNVRDYLKTKVGIDKDTRLNLLTLEDMVNVKRNVPKDNSGNIVAVYYAFGGIDMGDSSPGSEEGIVSSKVIHDLRKLKENENVKAVVLRVNSGGGSAYGSEQIWHAVRELKAEKPVIVSMGDYAASGGYYISCDADYIVAEPTTLTGSIGIFGMIPNVEGLTKKLGIGFDVVKTNKFADFGAVGRGLNNDEKVLLQKYVNDGYDLFLTRCAEGRNMPKEELAKYAEGRVWTGATAKDLGLVDELGGLDRALEIAIERAEIDKYTVMSYPEKKSFWNSLMETSSTNYVESQIMKNNLGEYYKQFSILKNLKDVEFLQASMPYDLNIK